MKKFIKKLIIYFCFIFAAVLIFQILLSLRIEGKTISENNNLELTSNVNADLVLLGSSRCSMHFDPNFFESNFKIQSVNLGVNGHSEITMVTLQLKYYLLRNKSPKYAILNFDPLTSAGNLNNNKEFALKDEFARYAFFPNDNDALLVDYFKFNQFEKYIPLYSIFKYRQLRNALFIKNTNDYKKHGYQMHNEYWDPISHTGDTILKKSYFNKNQIPLIAGSLNQLNKLCRENNIKLLCIQTPVYKIIYDKEAFAKTENICVQLGIPFIDINQDYFKNNPKFFFNVDHLNKNGVEHMNQFLKRDSVLVGFLKP